MGADPPIADPRYCLGCRYPLNHLTRNTCPECGRTFDPEDATTYAGELPNVSRKLTVVSCVLACCPLLLIILVHLLWLATWAIDGHRPYPKWTSSWHTNVWVRIPYNAVVLLFLFMFPLVSMLSIIFSSIAAVEAFKARRFSLGVGIFSMLLIWPAYFVYLQWDPWQILDWFFD